MEKQQAIGAPQKSCGVEQQLHPLEPFTIEEWLKDKNRKVVDNLGHEINPDEKTITWLLAHTLWFNNGANLTEFEQALKSGTNIYVEQGRQMVDWDARADAKELLDLAIKQLENDGYAIFSPQDIDWFPKDPEEARKKWQFSTTFQHGDTVWEPSESDDKCLQLTAEEIKEIREEEYREGYMAGIKHIPVWNKCQAPGCEFDSFIYREEKGGDQWLYHKGYKIKLECLEDLPKEERL